MSGKKILVVEDDRDITELLRYNLEREGYEVPSVSNGVQALQYLASVRPDLIILDLMMPEMDGLEVCRQLKADDKLKDIPVVMLTAKSEETDMVVGLHMGADDYITKPFSPKVLVARIKAVMRRLATVQEPPQRRQYGDLLIDLIKHKVFYHKEPLALTAIEFDILEFLSRSPGRVFKREQILNGVWKDGKFIIDRTIDVHVLALRKKLGPCKDYIETIRGIGYSFKEM